METSNSHPSATGKFDHLIENGYEFKLGDYLNRGFEIFKKDAGPFIGFGALALVIVVVAGLIPILGIFINLAVSAPLLAGMYLYADKVAKDEPRTFNDFFGGFAHARQLILGTLVMAVFILLGFLLFIIPGVFLAISYLFMVQLIIFEKMDFWTAMETSRKIVAKNWWYFFLFSFLVSIIGSIGYIALLIGIFVTFPIGYCIWYACYDDIIGTSDENLVSKIEEIGEDEEDLFAGIDGDI